MESFIILYIGLVCFLILFHLFAGIQTKFRSVWKRKEKYFYKMIVGEELQRLNRKKGVSTHHLSLLKRQLFHVNHLLLFEDVLVEFQKKNSIKETGAADNATLVAMFDVNAVKAK